MSDDRPQDITREDALRFEHHESASYHTLRAFLGETPVGSMWWRVDNGLFLEAEVPPEHRRRGIATALWREAVRRNFTPPVRMTANRTDLGEAWASTLGTGVERIGDGFDPEAARRGDY